MAASLEGARCGPLAFTGHNITIGKMLGTGTEAEVYACTNDNTGEELAVRVLNWKRLKLLGYTAEAIQKKVDRLASQVEIAKEIKNKHCLGLRDIFRTHNVLMLVMEIQRGGDLFDTIRSRSTKRFNEDEARYVFRQFLDGLEALHAKDIMHRDLKPENVLVSSQKPTARGMLYDIKICDYGWAKDLSGGSLAKTKAGSPSYCAPEVSDGSRRPYGFGADFWSLGVMLYALLWGVLPFERYRNGDIVSYELRFPDENACDHTIIVSEEAKDLIRKLLQFHSEYRAGMDACRRHPWLTGVRKLSDEENSRLTRPACVEIDKTRSVCKKCEHLSSAPSLSTSDSVEEEWWEAVQYGVDYTNNIAAVLGRNCIDEDVIKTRSNVQMTLKNLISLEGDTLRDAFPIMVKLVVSTRSSSTPFASSSNQRLQPCQPQQPSQSLQLPDASLRNNCSFGTEKNELTCSAGMPPSVRNLAKGNAVEIFSKMSGAWIPAQVAAIDTEFIINVGKTRKKVKLPSSEVRFTTNGVPNGAIQGDPVAIFNAIDANGDGVITLEEFKIAYEKGVLSQGATILGQAARIKELEDQLEQAKTGWKTAEKKELSFEMESSRRKRKHEVITKARPLARPPATARRPLSHAPPLPAPLLRAPPARQVIMH